MQSRLGILSGACAGSSLRGWLKLPRYLAVWTVLLLIASNLFMTVAWYGHLRHRSVALWLTILVSWGIALFEYCLQVPANRIGYEQGFSAAQLKTIQELITLVMFVLFARFYLHEPLRWNVLVGFALIVVGAAFVFKPI